MIALKTTLNGQRICIAGAEDLCVLNSIVCAVGKLGDLSGPKADPGKPPDIYLSVGGLTARANAEDEHLRWAESQPLSVGDEILITVMETTEAEAPTSRMSAKSAIEVLDRQRYENALNTFLELKEKYGEAFPSNMEMEIQKTEQEAGGNPH